jgi:hypothetical protein
MAESRAESPADRSDKMRHANKQNKKNKKQKEKSVKEAGTTKRCAAKTQRATQRGGGATLL